MTASCQHEAHIAIREKHLAVRREALTAWQERIRAEHPDAEFLPYGFAFRVGNMVTATGWLPPEDKFSKEDTDQLWDAIQCTMQTLIKENHPA
jgi:hypothetical protein